MQVCLDQRTGSGCRATNRQTARFCLNCGRPLHFAVQLHNAATKVGHYDIVRTLGYGGLGAVYEAEVVQSEGHKIRVALKECIDPNRLQSLKNQWSLWNGLRHPHLARYYYIFEENRHAYVVMELVPRENMVEVLKKQSRLPAQAVLEIGLKMCDVLSYLHSQTSPLFHGDIKPANLRLTPKEMIKLVDVGLVRTPGSPTHTARYALMPAYVPLEQWGGTIDARSDIYSLGATLYHLLTGQAPIPATERLLASSDPLVAPQKLNPKLAPHLSDALMVALALRPQERYQDAATLKEVLMGNQPARSQPPVVQMPSPTAHDRPSAPVMTAPAPSSPAPSSIMVSAAGVLNIEEPVYQVAFSPNLSDQGSYLLALAGSNQRIELWDIPSEDKESATPQKVRECEGHTNNIRDVAFCPDGQLLVSGSDDNTVRLWDVEGAQEIQCFKGHPSWVMSVTFSPDGTLVGSSSFDGSVRLWDVANGEQVRELPANKSIDYIIQLTPDGKWLAQGTTDHTVVLSDLNNGQEKQQLQGHTERVTALASHGQKLASGSLDNTIRLWDMGSGEQTHLFKGHRDQVRSVAFSPDGSLIASGSYDDTVRLWDIASGQQAQELKEHTAEINCVAFSPDGRLLASGTVDGVVRLWRLK